MEDLLLFDRLEVIRKTIQKYGEDNFVISFSGGKDSTVLHHLVDEALPGNKIPRVFINTGIEYRYILEYFLDLQKYDDRFILLDSKVKIKSMLNEKGYPFKSKEHSDLVRSYQNSGYNKTVLRYIEPPEERARYGCPKVLRYQFTDEFKLPVSKQCCEELKKKPFTNWQKLNNKPYKLTGERKAEGGLRSSHGDCLTLDRKTKDLKKFKPLNPMSDSWIDWYIESRNITLCKLYYEPFNFKRTGCKGCPYNINIQADLDLMRELLPNEYKQCIYLWGPVYDEYKRLNYRIKGDK